MIRILFQGDSITDGNRYKDPESRWDLNHQIGHSYVYPIVGTLGQKYPGRYVFINRGVSGDNVTGIAERWQRDTLDEKPDILSILLGINGANRDGSCPEGREEHLRRFEKDYRHLLDSARTQNPALQLILIEPFALPVDSMKEHFDTFMEVFSEKQKLIRRLAQEYGAIFIPVQERLNALVAETAPVLAENGCGTDPYAYWMWDGIHPTEPMHNWLAGLWLEAAAPIL